MIGAATRSGLARLITAIRATPGAQSRGHRDGGAALWAGLLGRQLHAGGTAMAGWRAPVSAGRSAAAASSLQPVAPESPGSVLVHPPRTHAAPSRSRPASAPVLPSALPGPLGWPAVPSAGVHSWSPPRAGAFGKTGGLAQAAGGLQLLLLAPGGIVQSRGGAAHLLRHRHLPQSPPTPRCYLPRAIICFRSERTSNAVYYELAGPGTRRCNHAIRIPNPEIAPPPPPPRDLSGTEFYPVNGHERWMSRCPDSAAKGWRR